jgi:prephenate dehydrogenase
MQLLVVGAGGLGSPARYWLADSDPAAAEAAVEALEGAVPARAVPLGADERFDVVCLAVPMGAVPGAVARHAGKATEAVVDVSGEMRDSVAALEAHADGRQRASFHPLFAAANAPGNVPVVVLDDGPAVAAIRQSLSAAGNEVFETTPEAHDRAMATVQAKAHTGVLAYALAAEDVDERFHTTLSGPLEDLVDQVVGNNPGVYADVQERYEGSEAVAEAARRLADADRETFVDCYEDAGR